MGKSILAGDSVTIAIHIVDNGEAVNKVAVSGAKKMRAGETNRLIATVQPDKALYKEVFWQSDTPDIANVDRNGLVTAYTPGKVKVRCISTSVVEKVFTITVK